MVGRHSLQKTYPFSSNWFDLDGLKLHYLDEGSGMPVLMLHGNPTWSYFYRNLVLKLREIRRCIVPDHIGCGLSDKPQDYPYCLKTHIENSLALIDSLKIKKIDLIVHDWGGAIGMGVAVKIPERIDRIVVMNSAAFLSRCIPFRISLCRLPLLGEWAIRRLNLFLHASRFMATSNPLGIPADKWRGYIYPYNSYNNRIAIDRFVRDIPLKHGHPSYPVLKDIEETLFVLRKKPVLIAWGMKDFCFTSHFLERWKEFFPGAVTREFKNSSHFLLEDETRKIVQTIEGFLIK